MEAEQPRLSLHMSKYHIVGNHMSRLKYWPLELGYIQPHWKGAQALWSHGMTESFCILKLEQVINKTTEVT